MSKQIYRNAPGANSSWGNDEAILQGEIAAEIEAIRAMDKDQLRIRWKELFKKDVPAALTKDLLARMIAYRIQERAFGGLDRATQKLLDSYANGKPTDSSRYLKSGTVVVREYQGVRHTVTIADGSYWWNEKKYESLSVIAKAISGTSWNGPRFFGLRESPKPASEQKTPVRRPLR